MHDRRRPRPLVNVLVELDGGAIEVDFLWQAHGLIVEADGYASHGTRRAFDRDRQRDRRLLLAAWRVARFTWRQVTYTPDDVAETLWALLADAESPRQPPRWAP